MQQENKLRYCARATNVRFFTRNTLSRFLTLKHMLATGAKGELETCTLCSIDQTTAMLCSSGPKAPNNKQTGDFYLLSNHDCIQRWIEQSRLLLPVIDEEHDGIEHVELRLTKL